MSLNSLQDDMSRRAASMAAMAKRATNPQDIQAIQKSLVEGVQNGSIQPYVGIPLIQDLTKKMTEAKAKMAQAMTGAGMQPPQGDAPIAQQVMQQAAQESQGLEALPSNLPQEYAGGGIIAFEEGGPVERFQTGNLVRQPNETFEQYRQRVLQQDAQNKEAQQTQENQAREAERQRLLAERGQIFPTNPFFNRNPIAPTIPSVTPAASSATPYDPATATRRSEYEGKAQPPAPAVTGEKPPAPALGAGQKPGITTLAGAPARNAGAFGVPAEPAYNQTMEEKTREEMLGLRSRTKTGIDELIAAQSKNKLEGKAFDDLKKNLEEEAKQAGMDKSDARAMAIFKAGLSIMGGTSRNALENIGKGAMVGAEDYQKANSELKKAEKERQKQFAAIEEARRAEDRDDIRGKNAALEKAYTANQNVDQLTTQAVLTATGKERELEGDIYKTKYAGAKGIEAANIQANATLGAARIGADSRLQTAEMKNALLTAGGGKAMTRDQAYSQLAKLMEVGNQQGRLLFDQAAQSLRASGLQNPTQAQVQELMLRQIMGGVPLESSTSAPPPGAVRLKTPGG